MLSKRRSDGAPPRSQGASAGKHHLYNQAMFRDERVEEIEFEVKCQYVEIYNETIYDLLDSCGQSKLQIREDKGQTFLENVTEMHVANKSEVMDVIAMGQQNRHVAATSMNLVSSRSHAVFTAFIKTTTVHTDQKKVVRTSRFHIVDLAGCEKVNDTNAEGQRLKELCKINQSLSNLGKVIYELSENSKAEGSKKQPGFINFRQSKLTHLLKDSLGGNSKTLMICTLNPHMSAIKETLSTIKFAQRAKMIRNKAVVNEENSDAEYWKQKYLALFKSSNALGSLANSKASHSATIDPTTMPSFESRGLSMLGGMHAAGDNFTPSWHSTLAKQAKEQAGLLQDSTQQVKQLL